MLRLVSGRQQWLVPVDAARELDAIVRERAAATPRRDAARAVTLEQGHELRPSAAQQLTRNPRGGSFRQRTVGFRLVVALPAALLGTSLISEGIGRGEVLGSGTAEAGALLVIAMVSAADWFRVRGRLRVMEDNALPPGSPAWGELGGTAPGIRCCDWTPVRSAAGTRRGRR